ncbi:putative ABC transport system permease protein [Streptomyces sp. WMMB 714]|uniref:ABC transporter permease n=1 Tax=Streptomyces sp. WMMB 714 TaxID=1286822 RepID=UPI0005F842BF|nr:ABC transporter permease [Streptomyces sp. WMMB 714]SCK38403.1 putative ABC transport system permease protein [Streptomyces sp. WMMB 714]
MTVFKASLRNFFAHKGRMALSAVAVVLSVAFVCGTLVFTDTMTTTFDKLFASTSADVTVSPKKPKDDKAQQETGRPPSVPESALAGARTAEGAKSVEGMVSSEKVTVVDGDDKNIGSTTGAPTIASNWTAGDRTTMKITSGHAPRGASDVMVDADTAKKRKLKLGDELRTITATGDFEAEISGIATFQVTNPGAAIVYFDTRTAQRELLGATDAYTGVAVTADSGVTHAELKKNVTESLGAGTYTYQTKKEAADSSREQIGSFLDVLKYALLGFAGIALLVGIFLIVNTFSMLVAQRTREIGLMRAIGSSRRQVNRSVMIEALLLGVAGSVLGVGAGVGLAVGLMELMGALGMNLSTSELTLAWTTPVAGLVLGILVTLLAAYLPARRAGRVSPMAALRDAGTPADGKAGTVRGVLGLLLTAGGGAGLYAATQAEEASDGSVWLGAGVVLTLVGFVVVGPLLAGGLVRVLSAVTLRPFGRVGRLAERNALRNPRRTGATAAALMIGLALVASLSVVGSSMVASATEELDRSVGADFIVQSGNGQPVTTAAEKRARKSERLKTVTTYKMVGARITAPDGSTAARHLAATEPAYMDALRRETTSGDLAAAYGKDAMSVGAEYAKKHGVEVGDTLEVAFSGGRKAELEVAAITSDDTNVDQGAMYTHVDTARQYLPADRFPLSWMVLATADEGHEKAAYAALKKQMKPYPQYQVRDQADYKKTLQDQVGQMLNMVYGLLALAIIVAVLGVVNTLALSVVERTREIGLMRAIGLSRRQLRRMIRLESVVIALFGALLGLGLGMCWGTAAQKLLALEGLGVLEIPWQTIGAVFVGSALVGLVAALVPAFRAGRMNVLNAIATE